MMRRPYVPASPRPRGQIWRDLVLFSGLIVVFAWAAWLRLGKGVIELRRMGVVRLADSPSMFWAWIAVHGLIVAVCGWLLWRTVAALWTGRKERQR